MGQGSFDFAVSSLGEDTAALRMPGFRNEFRTAILRMGERR